MLDASAPASAEMPKYQCHKIVHALKIKAWHGSATGGCFITPADERYATFETDPNAHWEERFKGSDEDLGYYVVYEDGYVSWTPTKAFEEGYTRI